MTLTHYSYDDGYRDGYLYGLTALKLRIEYWQKIQEWHGCVDDYGVSSQLQLLLRDVRELENAYKEGRSPKFEFSSLEPPKE